MDGEIEMGQKDNMKGEEWRSLEPSPQQLEIP